MKPLLKRKLDLELVFDVGDDALLPYLREALLEYLRQCEAGQLGRYAKDYLAHGPVQITVKHSYVDRD